MVQGSRTLVVMTNGDVYYLSSSDAQELTELLYDKHNKVYFFKDLKTGAQTVVHLRNVSSLVQEVNRG